MLAVFIASSSCRTPEGTMSDSKLQELKTEREPLFRRLASHPAEIHLALEIKIIDDQIAECTRIIQKEKKTRFLVTK
jgi:hypothetical protein